jgi:hypothetical protein
VADEFMDIMKVASISRKEARAARDTGMSAPEMPAKEVTPEFGFREASPSVAAAALAALKGGPAAAPRRGRTGTGRRTAVGAATAASPAAAPVEERAAPVAIEVGEADPEARRRRRRRGGRGRGRTRRDDETTPAVATGDEEIGWEEFDDLSQLDGVADTLDRELTFEEADAATLAELGLSADDLAAIEAAPEPEVAETPAPRRRSTRTRTAAAATAEAEAPAPRRRSPRTKAADAAPAAAEVDAPAPRRRAARPKKEETAPSTGNEPKSRRRSTRASSDEAAAPAPAPAATDAAEPQGIWGRFRSARKPRGTTTG